MEQVTVTTYHDGGSWWNRVGEQLHDPDTVLRFDTLEDAVRIGRRMAERAGSLHLVQHT